MIVYREAAPEQKSGIRTWLPEGAKVRFEPLLGQGRAFRAEAGHDGVVEFSLPAENSFALYRYTIDTK